DGEGVGGAHHRADVRVVLEILDRDVQPVAGGVELGDDRLAAPVAEAVLDVAAVAVGEQLGVQARVLGPGLGVGADADLPGLTGGGCGALGGPGHRSSVRVLAFSGSSSVPFTAPSWHSSSSRCFWSGSGRPS